MAYRAGSLARSLGELTAFLRYAGLEGVDEIDVADSHLIEWHGGGPKHGRHRGDETRHDARSSSSASTAWPAHAIAGFSAPSLSEQ
jgi:hypothetical protein